MPSPISMCINFLAIDCLHSLYQKRDHIIDKNWVIWVLIQDKYIYSIPPLFYFLAVRSNVLSLVKGRFEQSSMFSTCDNIKKTYGEEDLELAWRLRDDKEIEEYLHRWRITTILKSQSYHQQVINKEGENLVFHWR